MEAARPVVVFVSGPNWGSLTGAAPFDQNVFKNALRIADMREDFEVGYDQAGSSSADPRDFEPGKEDEKMRAAGKIGTAPPGQGVDWTDKKSVEKSHWFAGYVQRLKGIALSKSQDKTVTLIIFLCVEGGPITQLEQQKIGEIVREAKADNAMKGITKEIEISLVSYKMFVDKYDKPMELADPTIPELFEQLNLSKYSAHFTSEGYAQLSDLQDLSDEEELDGLISGAGMKKPEAKRLRKGLSKNLIPEGVPGQPATASAAQVAAKTPCSHGAAGGSQQQPAKKAERRASHATAAAAAPAAERVAWGRHHAQLRVSADDAAILNYHEGIYPAAAVGSGPPVLGLSYELEVLSCGKNSSIYIGVASAEYEPESVRDCNDAPASHMYSAGGNGCCYEGKGGRSGHCLPQDFALRYRNSGAIQAGDRFRVEVNIEAKAFCVWKNGDNLGQFSATENNYVAVSEGPWLPCVSLGQAEDSVRLSKVSLPIEPEPKPT